MSRIRLACLPTLALCFAVGCAVESPRRPEVHPVTGQLLVNGRPAAQAMIALHPVGPTEFQQALRPVGVTQADGSFRLMTYEADDGAPAGEYVATAVWSDPSVPQDECKTPLAHDRLQGRYADPATSPWRVTIRVGENKEVVLHAAEGWASPRLRDLEGQRAN